MAQFWIQNPDGTDWGILPLIGGAYGVSERTLSAISDPDRGPDEQGPAAMLVRRQIGPEEEWFLLARKEALIQLNGAPLALGARLLCDRDEIVVRGKDPTVSLHGFFSTERLAEVVPFPGSNGGQVLCPRCKDPIEPSRPAVRCPSLECGVWHHQDPEREKPCWTYGDTCTLCPQPSRLDGGFRWTPEQL
jgi:hypothetical protein